jgi:hypothetical protein
MGTDRHEEHLKNAEARPILGGILLTFTTLRRQNDCTDATPRMKEAAVFLPRPHAEAVHTALADRSQHLFETETFEVHVMPPDADGHATGWLIVRYGDDVIETDLTLRSVPQIHKALGEALAGPHPSFIRLYEHGDQD